MKISRVQVAFLAAGIVAILAGQFFWPFFAAQNASAADTIDPSVDFVQIGLVGNVGTEILLTEFDGDETVLLGTSRGLYVVEDGDMQKYIPTPGTIIDMALTDDISNPLDGEQDLVMVIDDTSFPNVRCYDVITGKKLWQYAPKQDVFLQNILWTEKQTPTYDVTMVADVNADGVKDVAVTSGYYCYMLNGKTGAMLWRYDVGDNLWRVTAIDDIDGDGISDVVTGAQKGDLYAISGADGSLVWEKKVAEQGNVYDAMGALWATVDRSVWDIVPVTVDGEQKLLVSAEDVKVRLVNPADGSYVWESAALIEYSATAMYQYYERKGKMPTGSTDAPFFNVRLSLVDDVSGDATSDVLAATYLGQSGGEGAAALNSGLFMIDVKDGTLVWSDAGLNTGQIARAEPLTLGSEQVVLLPGSGDSSGINFISLKDGETAAALTAGGQSQGNSGAYWVEQNGDGDLVVASNGTDLMCIETDGDPVWSYSRVGDVEIEVGEFVGDSTQDLLIWSKQQLSGGAANYGARTLYVVDGATREKAWSYEIPLSDVAEVLAIANLTITPDVNGDGKQDILGYTYPQASITSDKNYKIMLFSGANGTMLLNQHATEDTYYGLYEPLYEAKEISQAELDNVVTGMLTDGVQATYDDVFPDLDERPLLEAQIDDLIQIILTGPGDYNPAWVVDPNWKNDLNQHLDNRKQDFTINKKIYSLDIIDLQGDTALLVGYRQNVFILDIDGTILWTKNYNTGAYEDPFQRQQSPKFNMDGGWELYYLGLGDLNSDDVDDLVVSSYDGIKVMMSDIAGGVLNYRDDIDGAIEVFKSETGIGSDPSQVTLVDDLDGDGVKDISYPVHRDDLSSLAVIASSDTGTTLLQTETDGGGGGSNMVSAADFDADGYTDYINFVRWNPDQNKPVLKVVSGDDSSSIWQYDDYSQGHLFDSYGIDDITAATQIGDINDDGAADIVLGGFLDNQPGARLEVYDVVGNELIKEIMIEDIDLRITWEKNWHPCADIEEVGDYNGDGTNEVAITTLLTVSSSQSSSEDIEKAMWLMIIDLENEMVMAEFKIMASQFIDAGTAGELGVIGATGEIYFLNMLSDFEITSPVADSSNGSPLTVTWTGIEEGAFNQVYIDNVEVARTNGNEVIVDVAAGEHQVMVRSLDEYGRGIYTAANFTVSKGSGMVMYAGIALGVVVLIVLYPKFTKLLQKSYKGRSDAK